MKRLSLAALTAAMLLVPPIANAALPPFWQSAREIAAIVNDSRVHDALKYEEPILSVGVTAPDTYEVRTKRCTLTVKIVDKPAKPAVMGPRQFGLAVGEATCQ
jgi:hypothetical protein